MTSRLRLFRHSSGSAAAETALVAPLLLTLLFGGIEVGNYFLDEHALVKHVRDGARYASRLPLATSYTCPSTVSPAAETLIENVTKTGTVDGTGTGRFTTDYWTRNCAGVAQTVTVSIRCVPEDDYTGVWAEWDGDIPVVKVSGAVGYRSVLGTLGLPSASLCLRAESEVPAMGS